VLNGSNAASHQAKRRETGIEIKGWHHHGVIQQLNRGETRSAPKPAIPQVVDKVGVPDGI
jgi:hypothetical protein